MSNETNALPPPAVIGKIINGYWATFSVIAAARLGVADKLASGPKSVAALAEECDVNADAIHRLLRALASMEIFEETAPNTFAQTALSEPLRSGVPGSMRAMAMMTGMLHLRAWPAIDHSLKTGGTAFAKVFGREIFEYLEGDADAARIFDEAFSGYTGMVAGAVAARYDFSPFTRLVDVGGGGGGFLSVIAKQFPNARGVSFDLPHVAARAKSALAKAGASDRIEAVGGDFFASVPAEGDAYLLKMILHDWDDEKSIAILKNVRRAILPNGKLLVVEAVVPAGNTPSPSKLLDVNMLVMTGGRERTEKEYAALYAASGFRLDRVIEVGATCIVEGSPIA